MVIQFRKVLGSPRCCVMSMIYSHLAGVEGLRNVHLEEEGRGFALVEALHKIFHVHEIVMNAPHLYEGTLGVGD